MDNIQSSLDAHAIARLSLHEPKHFSVQLSQTEHRIKLSYHFGISPGDHLLEIGCGQGDMTTVLAALVTADGSVDAVDPGRPDYGSPYTLQQAQQHIVSSLHTRHVNFLFRDAVSFLQETKTSFDAIILVHCVWYFADPTMLSDIITACRAKTKRVIIAEYAASASLPEQWPHVLAAYTQAFAQANLLKSESNIQTLLTPQQIASIMKSQGWSSTYSATVTPDDSLDDGRWECGTVMAPSFLTETVDGRNSSSKLSQKQSSVVEALRDSCIHATQQIKAKNQRIRTMDVGVSIWTCP